MSMFDLGKDVVEEAESDVLGGRGPLESGLYDFIIKAAYITKSGGGAMAVNLELAAGPQTMNQTIYISSGDAKGNKFSYTDKEGTEKPLPGYSQINNLCLLACGKKLRELDPETKTLSLYNYDQKKDIPTEVPVIMELLDQEITAGVLKILEDKRKKNDQTGNYEPTGETRELNEIDKWFRTKDQLTVAEILAESTEAAFAGKWSDKNSGVTRDKSTGVKGNTGTAGAPAAKGEAPVPEKSLFG